MSTVNTLTGHSVRGLMRTHRHTIRGLARAMNITQTRVRTVRARGVAGDAYVRDWIEALTTAPPGPD